MFSDNVDLQRSASLTFAEITERGTSTRRDGQHSAAEIYWEAGRA